MSYKLTNGISIKGKTIKLASTFGNFEEVISKVNADLTSLWNGKLPVPLTFEIEKTDDPLTGDKKINVHGWDTLSEEDKIEMRKVLLTTERYLDEDNYNIIDRS